MTGEEVLAQVITDAKTAAGIGPGDLLVDWCSSARAQIEAQAEELNRHREALETIRDSFSQMSDNTHSNTAYALATEALDPKGCAEMAKLSWPPDEQIVADLKALDQAH